MQYCRTCSRTYSDESRICPRDNTPLESREELEAGMIVRERYRIVNPIGQSATARTWLVEDTAPGAPVVRRAMRVPLAAPASDAGFAQRFSDQASRAAVLDHPNVVRTEVVDRAEWGMPFVVMELLEGASLRWWLDRQLRLPWTHAAEIARQIALALEAAHASGLVHGDLQPEYVLSVVSSAPYPLKVAGFGLADAPGTPAYMSPERVLAKPDIGTATDIYSLGVILFEILNGGLPYGPIASVEQARMTQGQAAPELRGASDLPQGLVGLVYRMMARDPVYRPAASAAAVELGVALQTSGAAAAAAAPAGAPVAPAPVVEEVAPDTAAAVAVVPAVIPSQIVPAAAHKPQKDLLLALAIAALGVAVLVFGWMLWRGRMLHPAAAPVAQQAPAPAPEPSQPPVQAPLPSAVQLPAIPPPPEPTPLPPPEKAPAPAPKAAELPPPIQPPPPPQGPAEGKMPPLHAVVPKPPDPDELYKRGVIELQAGDREGARRLFEQAAGTGHANSMVLLGSMLAETHDYEGAFIWFRRAANLGNGRAMFWLGTFYETGKAIEKNMPVAVQWYNKAAQAGVKEAQDRLKLLSPQIR